MRTSKLFREGFATLFIALITSIFAGLFLARSTEMLLLLPGLIVLIPAANDTRGDVFGALSSRLGSALHLGSMKKFDIKNKVVRSNIHSCFTITLLFSFFLGIFAKILCSLFGIESISLFSFVLISLLGGIFSGICLTVITFFIAIKSYELNLDPDTMTSPIVTAIADFFSIPSLILAAYIVTHIKWVEVIFFVFMTIIIADVYIVVRKKSMERKIVIQSIIPMFISFSITTFSGVFLQSNIEMFVLISGSLVLLPGFLEEVGNMSNMFAARFSTKLHMGSVEADFRTIKKIKKEIVTFLKLSLIIFFLLSIIASLFDIEIFKIMFLIVIGGFLATVICLIITFFISIISYKCGIDPDNSVIPIMTSVTDLISVLILIAILHF